MNFEVESGKSIKLLTKNKVCTDDITITATGGGGGSGGGGNGVTYTNERVQYANGSVKFGNFSNAQDFEARFKGAVLHVRHTYSCAPLAMYPVGGGKVIAYYVDAFLEEYPRQETIVIENGKINWRFDPEGFFASVADEARIWVRYFTE